MIYSNKRLGYYISILFILISSIASDQITKTSAEKQLKAWEDPTDLKAYTGKKPIQIFLLGNKKHDLSSFFLEFNINYVRNQGAAWGFLSDLKDSIRVPFFHSVTLIAVIMILFYFFSTPISHRIARLALVFILSGAFGNLIDRIRLGYVIDFLDFRWNIPLPKQLDISMNFWPKFLDFLNIETQISSWRYNFPNFNWADSMITTGVFFLLIDMIFLETIRNKKIRE